MLRSRGVFRVVRRGIARHAAPKQPRSVATVAKESSLATASLAFQRAPDVSSLLDLLCRACVDHGAEWAGAIVGRRRAFYAEPRVSARMLARAFGENAKVRVAMREILSDGFVRALGDDVVVLPLVAGSSVLGAVCVRASTSAVASCLDLACRAGVALDGLLGRDEGEALPRLVEGRASLSAEAAAGARRIAIATGMRCAIHITSEEGGWLVPIGSHAPDGARAALDGEPIPMRDPAYGAVMRDGRPRLVRAGEQAPVSWIESVRDAHLAKTGVHELVVLPLGMTPIGTVTLVRAHTNAPLAHSTLQLAMKLTGEVAVRVDRARAKLVEGVTAAIRGRLAPFYSLTTALIEATRLADVAAAVIDKAVPAVGARGGALAVSRGDALQLVACANVDAAHAEALLTAATRFGEPEWLDADALAAHRVPLNASAAAALPLRIGERAIGAMLLVYDKPRAFSHDERRTLRTLSRQCAHAVERAEAHEAEQRANERLARIAEATALLSSSIEWEQTLDNITRVLVPATAAGFTIDLVTQDGRERAVAVHLDGGTQRALQAARPDERRDDALQVPLMGHEGVLGEITLFPHDRAAAAAAGPDRLVVDELVRRIAIALEHAQLHRRLRQALRARDDFLAAAGHELRTPLTTLHMYIWGLQTLAEKSPISPEMAARQLSRLELLVEHLLDVSRFDDGQLPLARQEMDLAAVVRDIVALGPNDPQTPIRLHADAPVSGSWDPIRISQVVTNLISNATKYGGGHPVDVFVEEHGDRARLRVRDHGIGIPEEAKSSIFERFQRAASSDEYPGLGLGLWISRHIVQAHGGTIQLATCDEDRVTEFVVELPRNPS